MVSSEWLVALFLVALGYALARVLDYVGRRSASYPPESPGNRQSQRAEDRRKVYEGFRANVSEVVDAAVNEGHGSYGMLYRIRDAYGDLLRSAPPSVAEAADSIIRCVTLLINLGPSDARYAMFTRALHHFDEACAVEGDLPAGNSGRREYAVVAESSGRDYGAAGASLKELEPRR